MYQDNSFMCKNCAEQKSMHLKHPGKKPCVETSIHNFIITVKLDYNFRKTNTRSYKIRIMVLQ